MTSRTRLLRSVLRVEVTMFAPFAGAVTALPVVGVFILGLAFSNVRGAIAMAIGANLVAIVSLIASPRLSLPLALLDALAMGLSVFLGTATSAVGWLHVSLLVPLCLAAGMMVVFGQTQGAIGSQAVIAYVVLGRFTGSVDVAWHLGLFVTLGALAEVVALVLLRLPPSLRYQQSRLAAALDAVGDLAGSDPHRSAIGVLEVVDDAERALASPSLFGRSDVRELRDVHAQLRRIRLDVTTLAGLRVRLAQLDAVRECDALARATGYVERALHRLGETLRDPRANSWALAASELREELTRLDDLVRRSEGDVAVLARQCVATLDAIAGQIRSAGKLIELFHHDDGRRAWRPRAQQFRVISTDAWQADLSLVGENLRRDSPAFRHAIRLAVAVTVSVLLADAFALPRGYWLAYAVAVILRPDYATIVRRGTGRVVGTALGAFLAALVVSLVHPSQPLTVVLVGLCAWGTYSAWSANFSVAIGFMTALVLILLNTSLSDPTITALERLLDVGLGGAIAVAAYLLWPTPPAAQVRAAHQRLVRSLAAYLEVVGRLVQGEPVPRTLSVSVSRRARVDWARAEAAVGVAVEEPAATADDVAEGRDLLSATIRILRSVHALRTGAERGERTAPRKELDELFAACVRTLHTLGDEDDSPLPAHELRALERRVEEILEQSHAPSSIGVNLDELVNAINTTVHLSQRVAPLDA